MKLESSDILSILFALLWLVIGIVVMWYANKITEQNKLFSKALSFWGLALLINAALAVYIPIPTIAFIVCLAIFLIGGLAVLLIKRK